MKTRSDVLVDAAWLDAHLHDPAVRVVEVDVRNSTATRTFASSTARGTPGGARAIR
jgi:3-mercaptopyruvate sulfurtransferase SseA